MADLRHLEQRHTDSLLDYVRVLRRRRWVILQTMILVPALAVVFSLRQERLYQAEAKVLLTPNDVTRQLGNESGGSIDPNRVAVTQARLARVRPVLARTILAAKVPNLTPTVLLARSSVSEETGADLLLFDVTHEEPRYAQRLATTYAVTFTKYRRELETAGLQQARRAIDERLAQLEAEGERGSSLYDELAKTQQELKTREALVSQSFVVERAAGAKQVQPRPVRNAILGLGLGILLGIGLAFLWEALDTRVRTAEEVSTRLGLPLLARIPEPPRRLRTDDKLVMLQEPTSVEAEAYRVLRTNLEFVNLERGARSLMVTSAVQGEGKSTTAANLAVALARTGKRVILVDLDLRRPYLSRFFRLQGHPGITDIALDHGHLSEAIVPVPIVERTARGERRASALMENGSENGSTGGVLEVVASGPLPPDPGEFIGTHALAGLLDALALRADLVIVDSPPLLGLGDAMTLSAKVDALLVVTRLNVLRRPMLAELRRVLEACPAAKLGFVLAGADADEGYAYGYYRQPYGDPERTRERVT